MGTPFSAGDAESLRRAERDVSLVFGDRQFDMEALLAISNIFRAATAVRNHMERNVLREHDLGWSAFVVLFVLRVWRTREANELATEAGVTPGTLTGVLATLERRGYVRRHPHPTDGRRLQICPTAARRRAIMPKFNEHEQFVTSGLPPAARAELSAMLRTILRTLDEEGG